MSATPQGAGITRLGHRPDCDESHRSELHRVVKNLRFHPIGLLDGDACPVRHGTQVMAQRVIPGTFDQFRDQPPVRRLTVNRFRVEALRVA